MLACVAAPCFPCPPFPYIPVSTVLGPNYRDRSPFGEALILLVVGFVSLELFQDLFRLSQRV